MGGLKIEHKIASQIVNSILVLFLTVIIGNNLKGNNADKIIYNKDYFKQFNITNINDALKKIPGVEGINSRNSQSYEPINNKKREVLVHQEHKY